MDIREAEKQVEQLAKEWVLQRNLAADATRQAAGLRKIVLGYLEMHPELAPTVERIAGGQAIAEEPTEEGRPRGGEAIRQVLHENANFQFWVSEMVDALKSRGWLPDSDNPANAVRTALERLVADQDSDVYKTRQNDGKVTYSYQPDRDRQIDEYGEEPF